jgi:transposase
MEGITEVVHRIACGLDIHSAVVVACLVRTGPNGGPRYEERNFATTLTGLKELRGWLLESGCEMVGMEATGVYWMPVHGILEGYVPMVVGNPQHMKALRGHKTDRKDAKWIATLVRHDLIRGSFIPPPEFRDARELTRFRRQLIRARTSMRNEIQRLLARQGIPLGAVLSNVFGVSGMAILEALAEGRSVIDELPKLIHRSVCGKLPMLNAALEAPLADVPRFLLMMQLHRLEDMEENIHTIEQKIATHLEPFKDKLALLMSIPGVSLISACIILAEIGVDMTCWPTSKHLAAWGGVAPGSRESGGKAYKAGARKGNPYLCTILVECAGAAVKQKECHLGVKFKHLSAQTGSKKKALMAIAHKLLVIVYSLLGKGIPYQETEAKHTSQAAKEKTIKRHLRELAKLGFAAQLTPLEATS